MCSPKTPFRTDNCMRMINSLKYDINAIEQSPSSEALTSAAGHNIPTF